MRGNYTKQDILRMVEEEDVEFIRLQFVDTFGILKNVAMTSNHLERILNNQCVFDGAAVHGYDTEEFNEFLLEPDLDTFTIFPWRPQRGKVARFICNVLNPDGTPYEADSRYVLRRVVEYAKNMGYEFQVGSLHEFFLFDTDEDGHSTTRSSEKGGLFDVGPLDQGENARRDLVLSLENMGFVVANSHHAHEGAQHRIGIMADETLRAADDMVTFRMATRTVARRHGLHATFMPKPLYGKKGSAMLLHINLFKDGKNIFEDKSDEYDMSQDAYHFMAGVMSHIKGLTLINNPIINSYKRLVPGYNAPVEITWSHTNRAPLVRLTSVGDFGARMILRSPDGASNPYLVLAGCLAAGLEGMKKKMQPPACLDNINIWERDALDILPRTLGEAVEAFEQDELLHRIYGQKLTEMMLEEKQEEWEEYSRQVTSWEVDKYLDRI